MSAVAPTMIGSATVRESRLAWSREKRAPAGRGQGDAVARDARGERRRLGDAEREAVGRRRPRRARAAAAGGRRRASPPRRRAGRGGRPRPAEAPLDRPLERVADDRRGQEGEAEHGGPARVEGAQLFGDQPAAGRSAAPPPRRRAARPRSSCAAPGRSSSQSQPASQGTRTMWAELETGSSSAGPWTTPSATARPAGIRPSAARSSARRRPARLGGSASPGPPPRRRLISR